MSYRCFLLLFIAFFGVLSPEAYAKNDVNEVGNKEDTSDKHENYKKDKKNKKDKDDKDDRMTLTKSSDMAFGTLEFSKPYRGILIMGTNGVATIRGRNLALGGTQQPGHIKITSTSDSVLEVRCSGRDTLRDQYGNRIRLYNAEISLNRGLPHRQASRCRRHGSSRKGHPALKIDLSSNPNPSIFMGALLYISPRSGLESGGSYVSTRGINMSFVFQ